MSRCMLCINKEESTVLIGDAHIPVGQSCYGKLIDKKVKIRPTTTPAELIKGMRE